MTQKSIIVTAGGVGKRMGAVIPKQFLLLNSRPVLMHTIDRFYAYDPQIQIILVLPSNQIDFWKALCVTHKFELPIEIVKGGKERFHSVQNGLRVATGQLIGVHDAVRPLVAIDVIAACFEVAEKSSAVVPTIAMTESIREVVDNQSKAIDRTRFRSVQTPQCFKRDVLIEAYKSDYLDFYTDDASVVEANGVTVEMVEGNVENIKITSRIDLELAAIYLKNEQSSLL